MAAMKKTADLRAPAQSSVRKANYGPRARSAAPLRTFETDSYGTGAPAINGSDASRGKGNRDEVFEGAKCCNRTGLISDVHSA